MAVCNAGLNMVPANRLLMGLTGRRVRVYKAGASPSPFRRVGEALGRRWVAGRGSALSLTYTLPGRPRGTPAGRCRQSATAAAAAACKRCPHCSLAPISLQCTRYWPPSPPRRPPRPLRQTSPLAPPSSWVSGEGRGRNARPQLLGSAGCFPLPPRRRPPALAHATLLYAIPMQAPAPAERTSWWRWAWRACGRCRQPAHGRGETAGGGPRLGGGASSQHAPTNIVVMLGQSLLGSYLN